MVSFCAKSLVDVICHICINLHASREDVVTCLTLSKLHLKDSSSDNHASDIVLSVPIKVELSHLKAIYKASDTKILQPKSDVIFFSVLCAHLVEKSPMKYYLTINGTCFIPQFTCVSTRK